MQKHKKMSARILSLALSVAMVTTMLPMTVFAAEGDAPLGASAVGTIQSFDKLGGRFIPAVGKDAPDHVYGLSVEPNTPVEDLNLPDELTAMVARTTTVSAPAEDEPVVDSGKPSEPTVDETIPDEDEVVDEDTDDTVSGNQPASPSDAKEEVKEEIKDEDVPLAPEPEQDEETVTTTIESESIPVKWNSDNEYRSDENGGPFIYTAVLPEGYILADGVKLPQIYVFVGRQARATALTSGLMITANTATADNISSQGWSWNKDTATLTLNGITCSNAGNPALWVPDGTTIELVGDGNTLSSNQSGIYCNGATTIQSTSGDGKLTISTTNSYGITNPVNGTTAKVTMKSGTVDVTGINIPYFQMDGGTLNINETKSTSQINPNVKIVSEFIINNGKVTVSTDNASNIGISDSNGSGKVSVNGGEFTVEATGTDNIGIAVSELAVLEGTSQIKGTTAAVRATTLATTGMEVKYNTGSDYTGETNISNNKIYEGTTQTTEAKDVRIAATVSDTSTIIIGGTTPTTGYETANEASMDKAVAAIADGGTIKLGANISMRDGSTISNKACTLDLNGKTLETDNASSALPVIGLGGTASLTITDSSDAKSGVITANATAPTIKHDSTGELKILDGTITSKKDNQPAIRCNSGTLTIAGGTVSNSNTSGFALTGAIESNGKITVTGGTVTSTCINPYSGTIKIINVPTPAAIVLDIQGGTVSSTGTGGTAANSVYFPNTVTAENRSSYYRHTAGTVGTVVPAVLADYTGIQAAAPSSTPSAKTATSITLAAVTVSGETIEYAKSTTSTAPTTGWQDSTAFTGLTADTQYYFFARVKANTTHKAGITSAATAIKTDMTDAQKVAAAKLLADTAITNLTATNATTAVGILSTVDTAIASVTGVTATWKADPTITAATDSAPGSIAGTIVLTCGAATVEVTVNKVIAQLGSDAEKVANAKIAADAALGSYTATNATAGSDIMALVNNAITDAGIAGITAEWKTGSGFDKTNATASATGSVTGTITLKLNSAEADVVINFTIAQLADKATLTAAITAANNAKSGITVNDNAASSVTSGVRFVTTAEMKALTDAITAAQAVADNSASTADQISAAITTLNNAVITFNAVIKTGTYYSGGGGGGGGGGGSTPTPPETKPTEPVTGSSNTNATVDTKGNATVNVTDKNIADAVQAAKDAANKKGVNAGEVTAVINVTSPANSNPNTVTVNLPKTVQQQVINNKIGNVAIVIDKPDISIGMNLATITEMNKQANADIQLSATRTDATKLSTEAKNAIGNRPAFDLKATYASGTKSITNFGTGSVSVAIPYTLQAGEVAGGLYAVYVDSNGKVNYITNSSYDADAKVLRFSTNHFSVYGISYKAPIAFTDIANHWAKTDIEFVVNRGLMSGTSNTTFAPNSAMTRGMFVTALGRLSGVNTKDYQAKVFTDVKADAYYAPYVNWAKSKSIVNGTTATTFAPDQSITRQEMAVIMSNYAKAMGYTIPETRTAVTFADNGSIGSWATAAVKQMQMAGILNGKDGNRFDPTGTATRGEISAMLHRYVEMVIDRTTTEGWTTNDSGSSLYYQSGKAVTGAKTINNVAYNFNGYGETTRKTMTTGATTNPALPTDGKKYISHKIVKGDTLWDLAQKHGTTVNAIVALNGIKDRNSVPVGTEIKIPQK